MCAFADDIVLMAGTNDGLQENVEEWNKQLKMYGMGINKKKTKVMEIMQDRGRSD